MTLHLLGLALAIPVFSLALAHVLEWPGKARLPQSQYMAVQRIFFPGFTVAGMLTELPALGVVVASVIVTGVDLPMVLALLGLASTNALFWLIVQPVNRHWSHSGALQPQNGRLGPAVGRHDGEDERVWRSLKLRWELGHFARAVSAAVAVGGLLAAVAVH